VVDGKGKHHVVFYKNEDKQTPPFIEINFKYSTRTKKQEKDGLTLHFDSDGEVMLTVPTENIEGMKMDDSGF